MKDFLYWVGFGMVVVSLWWMNECYCENIFQFQDKNERAQKAFKRAFRKAKNGAFKKTFRKASIWTSKGAFRKA